MNRLYVFCEGQTEQGFVNQVLGPHLYPAWDIHTQTILIAHSRSRGVIHRGGMGKYITLCHDITNELKRHRSNDVYFTTMLDLYKLAKDFPGTDDFNLDKHNPAPYVEALETAFEADIADRRFVPYLQLYEYETLLFSDPEKFRIAFDSCDEAVKKLQRIVAAFPSVEHINDGEPTAPSKRIIALLPGYSGLKPTAGPDIAASIGMAVLREKCPHFDAWVGRLEALRDGGI